MLQGFFARIRKILWAAFLVSLPVTNFPYFPAALGGSRVSVRPLLLYPLVPLLLLTLPVLGRRRLPKSWLPFFLFFLLVLTSTLAPLAGGAVSHLAEISLPSRMIRTLVTFLLAGAIFLVVSHLPASQEELDFTLRWLYVGLIIALIWASLQLIYVLDLVPGWFSVMKKIQLHITISRGDQNRLIGLTQEPSWFADQLAALYLPWILAAVLSGKTVFKRLASWLTVETILLAWIVPILTFTLSRSGYLTAAVVLAGGILLYLPNRRNLSDPGPEASLPLRLWYKFLNLPALVRILVSALMVGLVFGSALYLASRESSYISRMWEYWLGTSSEFQDLGSKSLRGYIRSIGFGPRFVYWEAAFRIFSAHPLLGVGLGNYTFYFQDFIPSVQVGYMPEILRILVPDKSSIITAKNFFARLLAETGIIGTSAFISFLLVLAGQAITSWTSRTRESKYWGAASLLGLAAFAVNTFSYDSLAIPNPWIVFGLIAASYQVLQVSDRITKESFP